MQSYLPRFADTGDTECLRLEQARRRHGMPRKIAGACFTLMVLMTTPTSEQSLDAGKTEGPYASYPYEFDYSDLKRHTIPAEEAPGIYVSNDFGGLLSTRGYNVVVDTGRISKSLQPNEIAVIRQVDKHVSSSNPNDDYTSENSISVISDRFNGEYPSLPNFLVGAEQVDAWQQRYYSRVIDSSGLSSAANTESDPLKKGEQDLGYGITRDTSRSTVSLQITRFDSNGSITTIEEQQGKITLSNNVPCEKIANSISISTEVKLTASQHDTVCAMLNEYSTLFTNYDIILDSTANDFEDTDMESKDSHSVILTYPYSDGKEVKPDMFRQIALHEILHAAYELLDINSSEFVASSHAYRHMQLVMNYKMPTDTIQQQSELSVRDVEPVWAALTESTYISSESRNGHPWDNPTEMLSSTAAVLTYYSEQFEKRFAMLTPVQQHAVYGVVGALRKLIEHYTNVDRIIPEYAALEARLLQRMQH